MLVRFSFVFLNLFIAASFFSPTLRSFFLIPGLVLWLVGYFLIDKSKKSLINRHLFSGLGIFYVLFLLVNFFLKAFYEEGFAYVLKSFFGTYLQWFWMFFMLVYFADNQQEGKFFRSSYKTLINTVVITASILSVIIIMQFLHLCPLYGEYLGILSQPFTNSGILLCSLFLTLHHFENSGKNRLLVVLLAFLQVVALLLLGQISSWFGLFAGLLIYFSCTRLFSKRQIMILFLIPCCLIGLAYNLSPRIKRKIDRFSSISNLFENKSMQCRFEIWKINYQLWLEKPILGLEKIIPYNCQSEILDQEAKVIDIKSKKLTHAHNIYLQNLFHGGLLRFASWIVFYLAIGYILVSNFTKGSLAFFCSYAALSIEGIFENWWGDSEVLTMFFLMVLMFYSQYKNNSAAENL